MDNIITNLSEKEKFNMFLNFVLENSAIERTKQQYLLENNMKNSFKLTFLANGDIYDVWEFNFEKCFRHCKGFVLAIQMNGKII